MRRDVDHLPSVQQTELERVTQLLMTEFAQATARASQPWKKNGRILKIILFGSYARNDWVDEPNNGYQSDYDLLVIVILQPQSEILRLGLEIPLGRLKSLLRCRRRGWRERMVGEFVEDDAVAGDVCEEILTLG